MFHDLEIFVTTSTVSGTVLESFSKFRSKVFYNPCPTTLLYFNFFFTNSK